MSVKRPSRADMPMQFSSALGTSRCPELKAAFSAPHVKEALKCTCAKSEFKSENHFVAVVYRMNYSEVKEAAAFDFSRGDHQPLMTFIGASQSLSANNSPMSSKSPNSPTSDSSIPFGSSCPPDVGSSVTISPVTPDGRKVGSGRSKSQDMAMTTGSLKHKSFTAKRSQSNKSTSLRRPSSASRRSSVAADAVTYLKSIDLESFPNPSEKMKEAMQKIEKKNWKEVFEALDVLRTLAIWHTNTIIPKISTVIREVNREADSNLRSAVRKNAVLCLQTLFCTLGTKLDVYLNVLIPTLLKRTIDGNQFLAGEAEVALRALILKCNALRALNLFIAAATSTAEKASPMKAEAVKCMAWAIEQCGGRLFTHKLLPKTLACVSTVLYDRTKHTRAYARSVVHALVRLLQNYDSNNQKAKLRHQRLGKDEEEFKEPPPFSTVVAEFQTSVNKNVPSQYKTRFNETLQAAGATLALSGEIISLTSLDDV